MYNITRCVDFNINIDNGTFKNRLPSYKFDNIRSSIALLLLVINFWLKYEHGRATRLLEFPPTDNAGRKRLDC